MATKKKGGPQTAAGKAVASQNSTLHGLTSSRPSSLKEKEAVQAYVQELTSYYKPDSPLEKLQIERIAICKAKLNRLYEIEQVQLELAIEKFNRNPDQVLDRLESAVGIVRGMVLEKIRYGMIALPCDLEGDQLILICKEIKQFQGRITKESQLELYFPLLTEYLSNYQPPYISSYKNLSEKFNEVCERIQQVFNQGENYHEHYGRLIAELERRTKKSEPEPVLTEKNELDLFIEAQQEARRKAQPPKKETKVELPTDPVIHHDIFIKQLKLFTELLAYIDRSLEVYEHYVSIKEIMIRGVGLPQHESDLLMRYQTTLDRRLSTVIGELLHLQSQRTR